MLVARQLYEKSHLKKFFIYVRQLTSVRGQLPAIDKKLFSFYRSSEVAQTQSHQKGYTVRYVVYYVMSVVCTV